MHTSRFDTEISYPGFLSGLYYPTVGGSTVWGCSHVVGVEGQLLWTAGLHSLDGCYGPCNYLTPEKSW